MKRSLFAALAVAALAVSSFAFAPAAQARDGVSIYLGPGGPAVSFGHGHGHHGWDRRDFRDRRDYRPYRDRRWDNCGYRCGGGYDYRPPRYYQPRVFVDRWGREYIIDQWGNARYTGRRY